MEHTRYVFRQAVLLRYACHNILFDTGKHPSGIFQRLADIQKQRLQKYLDTESEVLVSQEYQTGKRRTRRAELNSVRAGIDQMLAAGVGVDGVAPGVRSRRCILRD